LALAVFQHSSVGLSTVAFGNSDILFFWLAPQKLSTSEKWTFISEAHFDVDYDVGIKYGLIQLSYQLLNVQSCWSKMVKKEVWYLKDK
jgi:hypothetical protein